MAAPGHAVNTSVTYAAGASSGTEKIITIGSLGPVLQSGAKAVVFIFNVSSSVAITAKLRNTITDSGGTSRDCDSTDTVGVPLAKGRFYTIDNPGWGVEDAAKIVITNDAQDSSEFDVKLMFLPL
jgi:hypothetical protein